MTQSKANDELDGIWYLVAIIQQYTKDGTVHKEILEAINNHLHRQKQEVDDKWRARIKRRAEQFDSKFPSKKIGQHHYIRKRYLSAYLEAKLREDNNGTDKG